jgi:hypothetical protein
MQEIERNVESAKLLVAAIFRQAVVDILNCPKASIDPDMKYSRQSHEFLSADAKRFINMLNPAFQYYSSLLGYLPAYSERKLLSFIKAQIKCPAKFRMVKYELQGM